jgi:hypothetical protein
VASALLAALGLVACASARLLTAAECNRLRYGCPYEASGGDLRKDTLYKYSGHYSCEDPVCLQTCNRSDKELHVGDKVIICYQSGTEPVR